MLRVQITCSHCQKAFLGAITQVSSEIPCPLCRLAVPFPNALPGESLWFVAKAKKKVGPFSKRHLTAL